MHEIIEKFYGGCISYKNNKCIVYCSTNYEPIAIQYLNDNSIIYRFNNKTYSEFDMLHLIKLKLFL